MLQKVSAQPPKLTYSKLFRTQCYIDGAWVDADDKSTITVLNPADGTVVGTVPRMGAAEARRAVEAANAAWPACTRKTSRC
jgi:succinate-semialdehyde dehydrogenase/glutarate-semialdehyde dehydrogenase